MLKDLRIYNIRTMANYNKSRIYKIWCDIEGIDEFYIGSTNDFKERCKGHLDRYNSSNYNLKVYEYIRNNGGFENFYIDVIKKVSCNNDTELRMIEQKYIDKLKPTLNCRDAYLSVEGKLLKHREYNKINKNIINQKNKVYRDNNKTEINKKACEKIKCTNCDKEIRRGSKKAHINTKSCQNYIKMNKNE